ncbi:MAG: hypothetical protein IT429_06725 [Gemmataceae bacterium]|nr:hypothetical protein [Gemmataceae bacterium]
MPIRFRCAYCNQLMGIARRKAGTVVRCPTCSGQVVVPDPQPGDEDSPLPMPAPAPPPAAAPPAVAKPDLFERSDFEREMLGAPDAPRSTVGRGGFVPVPQPPPPLPPAARYPPPPPGGIDHESAEAVTYGGSAPVPGIYLTPGKATVLAVFVVVLIGIAFFAGMLVGRS